MQNWPSDHILRGIWLALIGSNTMHRLVGTPSHSLAGVSSYLLVLKKEIIPVSVVFHRVKVSIGVVLQVHCLLHLHCWCCLAYLMIHQTSLVAWLLLLNWGLDPAATFIFLCLYWLAAEAANFRERRVAPIRSDYWQIG